MVIVNFMISLRCLAHVKGLSETTLPTVLMQLTAFQDSIEHSWVIKAPGRSIKVGSAVRLERPSGERPTGLKCEYGESASGVRDQVARIFDGRTGEPFPALALV